MDNVTNFSLCFFLSFFGLFFIEFFQALFHHKSPLSVHRFTKLPYRLQRVIQVCVFVNLHVYDFLVNQIQQKIVYPLF
jgi:hypothetical protein